MLRKLLLVFSLVLGLGIVWAQGLETFENLTLTGTAYADGTFLGQDGSNWTYEQCRGDYEITAKAIMIGRNRTPQSNVYSGTISGGIGTISFDYSQAFSTTVNLNVLVNDVVVGNVTSLAQQGVILNSGPIVVNVPGDFVLKFINVNNSDGQVVIDNVAWTGYTATIPMISAIGTLEEFSAYTGTPSASQSYTLIGSNLTEGIVVTPPNGFAISTDDVTFYTTAQTLALDYNGPVYVRLTGSAAGSYSGNITHTSTGADQVDKAVSGTVSDPVPLISVTGNLSAFTTEVGTPSPAQSYTLAGQFLTANINIAAPAGFELSTDGSSYASNASVPPSFSGLVYVRLTGTTIGIYGGNITHTSSGATQVDLPVSGEVTDVVGPTIFMEENFNYTAGTLLTDNGWIAHSGAGTQPAVVGTTGLVYPNYPPASGNSAQTVFSGSAEDVHRNFEVQTSGTVYTAFLFNASSLPNTTGDYIVHMGPQNIGTDFKGRFFVQKNAEDNLRFGLTKAGAVATAVWTGDTYDYALNTTYLVVLKYVINPGPTNDEVYMWINPTIGATEPAPQITAADVAGTDAANIGSFAIRQGTYTPIAQIDGIRVTNDWAILWSGEAPPTPEIIVSGTPDPLVNIAGIPSEEVSSYQLSGLHLTGPITIVAPADFEVSTSSTTGWDSTIQVASTFSGPIYVRLVGIEVGTHGGNITHNSPGAAEQTVFVEGETLAPDVVWNVVANLTAFTQEEGTPSAAQSYSLSATNASADIIVTVQSPFELSTTGSDPWLTTLTLPFNFNGLVYVRLNSMTAGNFNGSIVHNSTNASPYEIPISGTTNPPAGDYAVDLFFSEYLEGSSSNKALEIFNGTGMAVDLSDYKVELYSNGSPTAGNTLVMTGMLAHGDVYVIANASANAAILAVADVTSTVTFFNGDDALALIKISTGEYVDIFGVIGNDPGTQWTADGGYSTLDKTLVRKPTVVQGVTVNPTGTGPEAFVTLGTEWDVYPIDSFSFLGYHTFSPGTPLAETPVFAPQGGVFYSPVNVAISTATPNATIYYTTDGSVPSDTNGSVYTAPVMISQTTTLKAIAYAAGYTPSGVASAEYIFTTDVATIAALRAGTPGVIYRLTGVGVLTFQQTFRNQKYIQDSTAGILIDDLAGHITTAYNLYNGIINIIGTVSEYGGMKQFTPLADPGAPYSINNTVIPQVITLAELVANFENYESELVKITNITFDTADGIITFANGIMYPMNTGTMNFRTTFYDVDYIGTIVPVETVNIIGLPNSRSTEGNLFTARFLSDFEPYVASLESPMVTITRIGETIWLTWNDVDGASSYRIEHSDDPFTGYTELGTTNNIEYSTPATTRKFYRVIAIN
ncbi:MAG: chitobiase/beta-hexosaminidase C-terminal domain-containing protein [Candidatus Syntrophosphaera sp.]|nr:chitobiase/beta-hexosaminidase C-terminal domain-containing protein [Candidatus Syntrophosphaera sp.]